MASWSESRGCATRSVRRMANTSSQLRSPSRPTQNVYRTYLLLIYGHQFGMVTFFQQLVVFGFGVPNFGPNYFSTHFGARGGLSTMTKKHLEAAFIGTAAVLLTVTGIAKLVTAVGTAKILTMADPISGVAFKYVLPAVGLAEILLGMLCFSSRVASRDQLLLVAWAATAFLLYRIGLHQVGWHHPCACMGALAGALHLSDQTADTTMKAVLAYLLLGSYGLPLWKVRSSSTPSAAPGVPGAGGRAT